MDCFADWRIILWDVEEMILIEFYKHPMWYHYPLLALSAGTTLFDNYIQFLHNNPDSDFPSIPSPSISPQLIMELQAFLCQTETPLLLSVYFPVLVCKSAQNISPSLLAAFYNSLFVPLKCTVLS